MSKITAARPHHVILYARVGREEPGALDRQVASLRQVALEQALTDVRVIAECRPWGISAEAQAAVCSADIVVVTSEDRLARRLHQLVKVRAAFVDHGVRVGRPGHLESADEARRHLAVLRMLADVSPTGRTAVWPTSVCWPSADAPDIAASSQQGLLVDRMLGTLRQHEREQHARRTRAGIAAAKTRREARR